MSNKQMMAGGLACAIPADDTFALEPLESRTFLSGDHAVAGAVFAVPMVQAASTRQDVMVFGHGEMGSRFSGERLRFEHHELALGGGGGERSMGFADGAATLFQISITFGRTTVREGGLVNHGTDRALPGSHHGPVGWPGAPVSAPSDGYSYEPDGDATALPVVSAPKQNGSTAGQVVKGSTKVLDRSSAVIDRAIASTVVTAPAIRFSELGLSDRPADVVRDGKLSMNVVPIAARQELGGVGKLQSALEATASLGAVVASQSMRWLENVPLISNSAPEAQAASATPEAGGGAAPMVERLAAMIVPRRVFNFARLGDPLAMLNDPLAAFVDESASSSTATVIGSAAGSSGAWAVTCVVIAADVVLLTYMYRKGRRSGARMNLDATRAGAC